MSHKKDTNCGWYFNLHCRMHFCISLVIYAKFK